MVRRVVDAMPLDSLDAFLVVRSAAPLSAAATGQSSGGGGGDAAMCHAEPPEVLAAKARRASEMGTAAVQSEVAAAAAAAAAAATSPRAAAQSAASAPPAAVTSCGSGGKSCGSGSGGCSGGAGTAVAMTAVAAGSSTCSSAAGSSGMSSAVMAAARAVLTAQDRCIPLAQRQQLLDEMRGMPLYTLVNTHLAAKRQQGQCCGPDAAAHVSSASTGHCKASNEPTSSPASKDSTSTGRSSGSGYSYLTEKAVMALLIQPPEAWPAEEEWADPAAAAQWRALLAPAGYGLVDAEASYLREQHTHIEEVLQVGAATSLSHLRCSVMSRGFPHVCVLVWCHVGPALCVPTHVS